MMKRMILLLLSALIVLSCMPVFAAQGQEVQYGADNLNNDSGDLVIGFLGGSITEGSGATSIPKRWASRVVNEYFKVNYPNKNVIEKNAAIGGTGSDYGMLRVRRDLGLETDSAPDVVFVEFAVNDSWEKGMSLSQKTESIVRQLMSFKKIPVIIFIYTTSVNTVNNGASTTSGACVENAIAAQSAVAEHYGIYSVNLNDYIWEGVKAGEYVWKAGTAGSLTGDGVHPNDSGYDVYTKRIIEMLTKDKSKAFKKLDPDLPPYGDYVFGELEEILLEDYSVKLTGDWQKKSYTPIDMTAFQGRYHERFYRDGYMYNLNGVGAQIEYEFTGRGIGIDYLRTKNNANIQWSVYDESGKQIRTGTLSPYYKTDTGRCCGQMLVYNLPYGKYKFVAKGVLNQQAVIDNKANTAEGGTGTELNIGYLVVEKSMPKINPYASDVKITDAFVGKEVNGSYKFNCKLYGEKDSEKAIYVSGSENGQFTKLADGASYTVKPEDLGKFIKFGVTPKNTEGVLGKTVYSAATKVLRPVGELSFASPVTVKLNGADAAKPGAGTNAFSGVLANSGRNNVTVNIVAATYKTDGGYKYLTGSKAVSKTIESGKTADFTVEINAAESDTEIALYAICADSMEPTATVAVEYMGTVVADDIKTTVYKINSFID